MPHQAHNPKNYGRALMSVLPQATAHNPHTNLQIKWGFNNNNAKAIVCDLCAPVIYGTHLA
jgi:hypothetical protein